MKNLKVEIATHQDIPEILKIENMNYKVPWDIVPFRAMVDVDYILFFKVSLNNSVLGYIVANTGELGCWLMRIGVHKLYQKTGIGAKLVKHCLPVLKSMGETSVGLYIRASDGATKHFVEGLGFDQTGVKKDYYSDGGEDDVEDAVIMSMDL